MGDYLIRRLTNQDELFYPLVGPFLGSRQVAHDIGVPAWDDPGKVWYVAMQNGVAIGFVAVVRQQRSVVFCSDYVSPEHKGTSVYAELSATRMRDYADAPLITATVSPADVQMYTAHSFLPTGTRGRYTPMRKGPV